MDLPKVPAGGLARPVRTERVNATQQGFLPAYFPAARLGLNSKQRRNSSTPYRFAVGRPASVGSSSVRPFSASFAKKNFPSFGTIMIWILSDNFSAMIF
jgi:hypothetical protein